MSSLFTAEPQPRHILRFQRPDNSPADLTLDEAFERLKLPELRGRSPETVGEYFTHLRRWRECWDDLRAGMAADGQPWEYRTTYPVVREIRRKELVAFRNWLQDQTDERGRPLWSNRTVNKHLGSVYSVLQSAADHDLLPYAPPKLKPLPARSAAPKHWLQPAQVNDLMHACRFARWPAQLAHPAPLYWRCLVVLACNYAMRTQELVAYESRMEPLDWSGIHWTPENPDRTGKESCPWGWLVYTPAKQANIKPEPLVLPLNETAHRWLKAIAPATPAGPVFPFPLNSQEFYETWRTLTRKAKIEPKPDLDGNREDYQFRHLRKTAITWIEKHYPGFAGYITGHARTRDQNATITAGPSMVLEKHYNASIEAHRLAALSTLPQPESFRELLPSA